MKKSFKSLMKLAVVTVVTVIMMFVLTACTAVQISANVTFNEDGTGSRTITASIAKNDNLSDGYGMAYYYLTKHGDELAQYLQEVYTAEVSGSENWLDITVDDSGADWEVISLTFDFDSLDDYQTKLAALAYDETAGATYVAPEFTANADGTATYSENTSVLTAIFKSIQTSVMADTTVFDINSTKDGQATNNGTADLQSLTDFGVELMKVDYGTAMTVQLGTQAPAAVEVKDGVYTITGNYEAKAPDTSEAATDETTTSSDDTSSAAADSTPASDVPKTGESNVLVVISLIGLAGCAAVGILSKKRYLQNQ